MPATHQGEFHLILHILDMEAAARIDAAREDRDDLIGQFGDGFVHAARGGGRLAFDCKKGLGQGNHDPCRIEWRDRAVAPDDPIAGIGWRRGESGHALPVAEIVCIRRKRHRQTPIMLGAKAGADTREGSKTRNDKPAGDPPGHPARGRSRHSRGRSPGSRVVAFVRPSRSISLQ